MNKEEGILYSEIKGKSVGRDIAILSVYNTGEGIKLEEIVRKVMKENREKCVIIGGDFNIRIAEEGGVDEIGGDIGRKSKDKIISHEGKKLIDLIRETGGYILNGTARGDKEGEFTYTG